MANLGRTIRARFTAYLLPERSKCLELRAGRRSGVDVKKMSICNKLYHNDYHST